MNANIAARREAPRSPAAGARALRYEPRRLEAGQAVNVYVWTDYVCPFCLLGEGAVKQAVAGLHARLIWMPFELRPFPEPTLRPEDDYLTRTWAASVYPAAQRLGVPIRLPTISPQPYTRTAFIGMQYARDEGLANAYTEAVLRAFFQRNLDVGDVAVLKRIASEVGLDATALEVALSSPAYARRHDDELSLAHRIGIQAVPTTLIGKRLVQGMGTDVEGLKDAILTADVNLLN
ncbi:MAG TPA: DsbA family protein [Nevskiaceae bacterium]